MQVHQPQGSDAEATTKYTRIRPPLASMRLDTPNHCDICGRTRSSGRHTSCSKERQKRLAPDNTVQTGRA